MSNQIKGLLYFFILYTRRSFFIFWGILFGFLVLNFIIALLFIEGTGGEMIFGLSLAVYIYSAIYSFHLVKQGIPFVLKMGATRKKLFLGLGMFLIGLTVLQAVIANVIQSFCKLIIKQFSIDGVGFISIAQFFDTRWITSFTVDATIIFFVMSVMIMLSLFFYKYGLTGGGGIIALVLVFVLFGFAEGFLKDFVMNIAQSFDLVFFFQLAGVGFLLYLGSWGFFRKITID